MANSNFVVHNGLTVGPLTIDATTGAISTSGTITSTGGGYLNGALGANTPNSVVATSVTTSSGGQLIGYHTGALGANTPNSVVATSVTTSSGGQLIGYHTGALGANTPNSVVATSVTTSSGGQLTGYLTGAIGANSANSGAFTTITSSSTIVASGNIVAASGTTSTSTTTGALVVSGSGGLGVGGNLYVGGNLSVGGNTTFVNTQTITTSDTIAAPSLSAGVIGNTNAVHYGTTFGATSGFLPTANNTVTVGNATNYMSSIYATNYYVANAILPISNVIPDIGSAQSTFDNVYAVNFLGTSTTAKYADLAERYSSDADYEPGTVVDFGGSAEITLSTIDGSQFIAGVISTNPAYLMNDNDKTMLPVALVGRVPCKVTGPIQKGAMLVSKGDGTARMERYPIIGSVLGKALESHGDGVGVIEVVVGRL